MPMVWPEPEMDDYDPDHDPDFYPEDDESEEYEDDDLTEDDELLLSADHRWLVTWSCDRDDDGVTQPWMPPAHYSRGKWRHIETIDTGGFT